ncbi:MAG: cupin domain-containing protein [Proteobacteria bacterium]|nr:cupin domain-containing protein [Pseudomonadota bacterium]
MAVRNLLADIPPGTEEEFVDEILRTESFRIERIVSRGQASPPGFWYDQQTEEWVLLASGTATLGFDDGRKVDLKPGDHLFIPRHVRHRVERTDPEQETVWLAVYWIHGA